MKLLVEHGTNINATTNSSLNEETNCLEGEELTAGNNSLEAIEYLLTLGAPINGSETMYDPLGEAAEKKRLGGDETFIGQRRAGRRPSQE